MKLDRFAAHLLLLVAFWVFSISTGAGLAGAIGAELRVESGASGPRCARKRPAARTRSAGPSRVDHLVQGGDTLSSLAEKYGVSVKDIRRWNGLRSDAIYVGRTLVIHSNVPVRAMREVTHVVAKGETLGDIAARYGRTVAEIQALNRIQNARMLRAGATLRIRQPGPEQPSEAVGRANGGRLVKGEQMPPGGTWYLMLRDTTSWGTNETITQLTAAIRKVYSNKKLKRGRKLIPPLVIGDISRKSGGHLPPHKSHQNGRDVDIGYYVRGAEPDGFVKVTRDSLDCELTWALLDAFIKAEAVDYIFIDRKAQQWLYEWAAQHKKLPKVKLDEIFEYRSGGGTPIIRHEPGHLNHMHVRFRCPSTDESCT